MKLRAAVLCVSMMLVAAPALADTPGNLQKPDAVAHFTKGNALYKAGEFADAINEYKAGMLVEPSAVFNFNLGQSYRQLGDYKQAKWQYQRYLASGLASEDEREAINKLIASMDAEAQQKARTDPPTEPATLDVKPEVHVAAQPVIKDDSDRWYHDAFGWGLTGSGVVVGAVAGVLVVQAADYRDDASAAATAEQSRTLNDKADTRRTAAIVTGVLGTSLVAAGVIKLVIHKPQATSSVAFAVGLSPSGFVVAGRF